MKKLIFNLLSTVLISCTVYSLSAQGLLTHHFNDGTYGGFEIPKTDQEDRVNIVSKRVQTDWDQDLYNGTNSGRKAQIRPDNNAYNFTNEFWTGYWLKIHGNTLASNTNTEMCLMQIWGHNDATGSANWYAMLKYDGRNGGALVWQHRYNSVADIPQFLVYPDFPKDTFVKVVIRIKLNDTGDGVVQIWIDDELRLSLYDQTIGWGDMNANGMHNQTYSSISYGQYNYMENSTTMTTYDKNSHTFNGHASGETRTVTYDKVTLWDGADGYDIVHPNGSSHPDDNFHIIKRNASSYGLNGGSGGSNGQNISLHSSTTHNNLTWTEINRGDGYYSYQKLNTNYCIDGGNGGSNNQNAILWECDETNYNQQWLKVDVGSGYYRLQKRNASGYSLNGGSGGSDGQNVNIYSNASSQNMQWQFNTSSNSNAREIAEETIELEDDTENIMIFPNPTGDLLNIQTPDDIYQHFEILTMGGKTVIKGNIEKELHNFSIDVSNLDGGVYMLSLKGVNTNKAIRLIKD